MREIRTLRARWRELETELRIRLNGHEGGNPGYSQANVLTGHRASSRPYIRFRPAMGLYDSLLFRLDLGCQTQGARAIPMAQRAVKIRRRTSDGQVT